MQDIIHLLPDSVANQIAAGEVVQRPSSVVKELMENSVDACATSVQVVVIDGGRTLIQVIDDGKGMSETDARLAFERHATSKIKCADDLFALSTMGFRGEALASIAAVSEVELITRRKDDELATRIVIAGSRLEQQDFLAAPSGSNFKVKNLFYNIPARRKFLKSLQTELNNIVTEFERVALINPSIEFSLSHNGNEIISLQPSSFRQRIMNLFGKRVNSQLIEVGVTSSLINVKGFVGAPESARKKGALQFFFVNGRYMRHPYFAKAVAEAYNDIIPPGEQVPFFLILDVDPSRIDVNIHPTKTEIKFEDESSLWKIISAAVRESLGRFNAAPSLGFDDDDIPDIPAIDMSGMEKAPVSAPKISYNPGYNPFKAKNPHVDGGSWEMLYEDIERGHKTLDLSPFEDVADQLSEPETLFENKLDANVEEFAALAQYKGTYILVPAKSGLMWIHQRRAHIRVLYEKYLKQLSSQHSPVQRLLFPERLELSLSESIAVEELGDELLYLGFDVSTLGGGTFVLNGAPSDLDGMSPVKLLKDILYGVVEHLGDPKEELHENMALAMARDVAIITGQILSSEEMDSLINELFACKSPAVSPDGKTIVYIMPDNEIDKKFIH